MKKEQMESWVLRNCKFASIEFTENPDTPPKYDYRTAIVEDFNRDIREFKHELRFAIKDLKEMKKPHPMFDLEEYMKYFCPKAKGLHRNMKEIGFENNELSSSLWNVYELSTLENRMHPDVYEPIYNNTWETLNRLEKNGSLYLPDGFKVI